MPRKISIRIETPDGEYQTSVNAVNEVKSAIKEINVSPDNALIMIGSLVVRAGAIKSICVEDE